MNNSTPAEIFLHDYQSINFIVERVSLEFDLNDDATCVASTIALKKQPSMLGSTLDCVLNGEDLDLQYVAINGVKLNPDQYAIDDTSLTLFSVPDEFILETRVIIYPHKNKSFMGLYQSRSNYCTQCEAEGFRKITYFFDRPDVMTRFTTTIRADKDKYPFLLSNGNCLERKDLDNGRHEVVWEDPSLKPCYLFALVAGDFDLIEDHFVTMSGRHVTLEFFLEKGFRDQGFFAMESLKRAMRWDEEKYGREYDLDIYMVVAVSDFNMGAMENKGLNVFNTKYVLANPKTATDADHVGIEDVIGHEYFHNWTGNRITCRDWFQLTLKEGLTVFRDQTFSEDMTSPAVARINEVNVMRQGQFPEDAGPLAHPIRPKSYIEINNFYTATVYRKGAEVIRMIHTLVTAEGFRKGMDLYFSRHDGQAVTTEDFVAAMSDANNKDLTQFSRWYDQAGTPLLQVSGDYNADQQTYTLKVRQSCPDTPGQTNKLPFHMPFSIGLLSGVTDAESMVSQHVLNQMQYELQLQGQAGTHSGVLELTEAEHEFVFTNIDAEPIPVLNRGFSAPVKVEFDYTDEQLAHLMLYASDAVARWDASQLLFARKIADVARAFAGGHPIERSDFFANIFHILLERFEPGVNDANLLSQILSPPSLMYVHQCFPDLDIVDLHRAWQWVVEDCAGYHHFNELFIQLNEQFLKSDAGYTYNVSAMGERALCNLYLFYSLCASADDENISNEEKQVRCNVALDYFNNADNMTNKIGALVALNDIQSPVRETALAQFYTAFKDEPLVVNKWLTLQASSILPNTLDRVIELTQHEAFDIKNPNNVYALICAFGANHAVMHTEQARAYTFIADQVLALDAFNPQVAARVLTPLTRWRQWDKSRGTLMREQLLRIQQAPNLSSDVFEMVEKSTVL
jgi:aminopeptidase N